MARKVKEQLAGAVNILKPRNMEDVLEAIGGFGKFQIMVLALMLSLEIPTAFLVFVPVFIGAAPSDWLCDDILVSKLDACTCAGNLTAIDPNSSVVAEWGLVCSSAWVSDTIVSIQFSGMLFGNIYIAQLSDWYGRRYCFLGIALQMALGTVITAVAPNYYVYAIARFICGSSFSGFLSLTAVYSMEFLTPNWRPVAAAAGPFGWGIMLLGLLAYYIQSWRTLVWITAIPFVSIFFIFPFIPESPRWLLRNQKLEECHKVLGEIARKNGKENVDIEALRYIMEKESASAEVPSAKPKSDTDSKPKVVKDIESTDKPKAAVAVQQFSYLEFYRNPNLRKTTLCLQGIWFTWGLVYFGLSYNIKNMPGSPYLNIMYMGLMDAIGYPFALIVNNRFGRRKSLVMFMTLCAFFLVGIAVLQLAKDFVGPSQAVILAVLALLGRFSIAGGRSAARTLTGESYPTAVRVMGIGFAGCPASFGGALAPQLVFLGSRWPSVPFFGFAIISVGGSLVSFLLREMSGQPLLESMNGEDERVINGNISIACAIQDPRKLSISSIFPIVIETQAISNINEKQKIDNEKRIC